MKRHPNASLREIAEAEQLRIFDYPFRVRKEGLLEWLKHKAKGYNWYKILRSTQHRKLDKQENNHHYAELIVAYNHKRATWTDSKEKYWNITMTLG